VKKKWNGFVINLRFLCLIGISLLGLMTIVATGGGGGGDGTVTPSVKLLASEFEVESNWTAYGTYDQLEDDGHSVNASLRVLDRSLNREKIITYTANGLVSEIFEYLVANNEGLAIGSRRYGVSVLKFSDMGSPKGNVYNYRKEFLEGIAEYQNKFYAWFLDGSIVDIASGEMIYEDAPMGTNSIHSTVPKNRFAIDNGEYFIGTSNLDSDGSLKPNKDNGLWKIDAALSTKTKLLDHPVWCVYKDGDDIMWVGTKDGIYQETDSAFEKVYTGYAEQIFEFNDQTYALIKDFFSKPDDNNDFDLYQWDGATFQYVCEVSEVYGFPSIFEMYAFEWDSTLYVSIQGSQDRLLVFDGTSFTIQNNPIYDGKIGQQCAKVADEKLFTVGNLTGLNIWDGVELVQLNTVNTAEALISNAIQVLYVAENGNLWIGPETSGFNILDNDGKFEIEELPEEIKVTGIFETDGTTYVQGAAALYEATDTGNLNYKTFACNGERVYYDAVSDKLWAYPNFGVGNGSLGMLDIETKEIYGTTGFDDRADYWQRDYEWIKPEYHFNDVVSIPNENAVFIAVQNSGVDEETGEDLAESGDSIVLKYDYGTDEFSEISIPIEFIRYFAIEKSIIYGIGKGTIAEYVDGEWQIVRSSLSSNYPVDLVIKNKYAFIPNRNSLEVLHLASGKSSEWNFTELPIKGNIKTVAMRTNENPGVTAKAYSMYFGTSQGLVICDLNLQSPDKHSSP